MKKQNILVLIITIILSGVLIATDSSTVSPPGINLQAKCYKVTAQTTPLSTTAQKIDATVSYVINPASCRWVNSGSYWVSVGINVDSSAVCNTSEGEVAVAANWQMKGAFSLFGGGATNIGVYCCKQTVQVSQTMSQTFQNCP